MKKFHTLLSSLMVAGLLLLCAPGIAQSAKKQQHSSLPNQQKMLSELLIIQKNHPQKYSAYLQEYESLFGKLENTPQQIFEKTEQAVAAETMTPEAYDAWKSSKSGHVHGTSTSDKLSPKASSKVERIGGAYKEVRSVELSGSVESTTIVLNGTEALYPQDLLEFINKELKNQRGIVDSYYDEANTAFYIDYHSGYTERDVRSLLKKVAKSDSVKHYLLARPELAEQLEAAKNQPSSK